MRVPLVSPAYVETELFVIVLQDGLHLHLTSQGHSVLHVRAEQHTYTRVDEGLSIEEVAALVAG
jgi:hypothetical protein